MKWKKEIVPSSCEKKDAVELWICKKCGCKYWYFGKSNHSENTPCVGCETKKSKIIRNNPKPIRRNK